MQCVLANKNKGQVMSVFPVSNGLCLTMNPGIHATPGSWEGWNRAGINLSQGLGCATIKMTEELQKLHEYKSL